MRLDCLRKDERFSGCQDHVQESPTVAAQDDLGQEVVSVRLEASPIGRLTSS